MNIVFIVPTGVGAEIGGHSGDATPAAKLVASVCDKLIIHPNVVNASDINEMTENMLYVEGSTLDRFLQGNVGLEEVRSNKILVVVNSPVLSETVNALNAARVTMGADISLLALKTPLVMVASMINGQASGRIENIESLITQVKGLDFDVLIINTPIQTDNKVVTDYLQGEGGVNPWGGIEAELSKFVSVRINKPVFHAPIENSEVMKTFNEVVDPRKSAELVSTCYIHCCLKGAHKAPKLSPNSHALWSNEIDFMVSPAGLFGKPHRACKKQGIPIIGVLENRTAIDKEPSRVDILVNNYLEAIGVICANKSGVTIESVTNKINQLKMF